MTNFSYDMVRPPSSQPAACQTWWAPERTVAHIALVLSCMACPSAALEDVI